MSKNGRMSFSLIKSQIMRVISSPRMSTTGPARIFAIVLIIYSRCTRRNNQVQELPKRTESESITVRSTGFEKKITIIIIRQYAKSGAGRLLDAIHTAVVLLREPRLKSEALKSETESRIRNSFE